MGGQLVFDWDQLENFLITRDWPVGNKVTNTISYAKVEYHMMCKYSAPCHRLWCTDRRQSVCYA